MENKTFTISVYSENNVGLLNRISGIFLKRHINILSLNVSESEIENVSRFIIVVNTTEMGAKYRGTNRKTDRSHQSILPY
jgi:acetolactate synthase-1/3 small subunit